jgi:hypothetical protein
MLSSFNSTYTNFALDRTQLAVREGCCRENEQQQRCAEVDEHLEAVETALQPDRDAAIPRRFYIVSAIFMSLLQFPICFLRNKRRATNNNAVVRGDLRSETLKLT